MSYHIVNFGERGHSVKSYVELMTVSDKWNVDFKALSFKIPLSSPKVTKIVSTNGQIDVTLNR